MSDALVVDHSEPAIESVYNGKLAMWLFLCSEVMFFSGLLGAYIALRLGNPGLFAADQQEVHVHVHLAAFNTILLIGSSLTMALAVLNAQQKNTAKQRLFLLMTAAMGALFICLKFYEYNHHFHDISPYQDPSLPPVGIWPRTSIYFAFYYGLTGVHAFHIIGGIIPIMGLWWFAKKKDVSYETEMVGLYWHFVDLVWIFLFPLLYLI